MEQRDLTPIALGLSAPKRSILKELKEPEQDD